MAFGPMSAFNISQRIPILMNINRMEKFQAVNEMRLDVD
jgi:hypothetical protein